MALNIERLALQHRQARAAFSCGVESLDIYLQRYAAQDQERHATACWVLYHPDSAAIAGYYTLSMSQIDLSALQPEHTRRLPRYPYLPAALLGRLAVDSRYRGRGIGEFLLTDAIKRVLGNELRPLALTVDALDERAVAFYEHFGFHRFADAAQRLYLPLRDLQP